MPTKTIDGETRIQTHTEEKVEPTVGERIGLALRKFHFARVKGERDEEREKVQALKGEIRKLKKQLRDLQKGK